MKRRAITLAMATAVLLAGCGAPGKDMADTAEMLAEELGDDQVTSVTLIDTRLTIRSLDREAGAEIGAEKGEVTRVEQRYEQRRRPLADFDLEKLGAIRDKLDCEDGWVPVVHSDSLLGGGMVVRSTCAQGSEFGTWTTEFDGKELGPVDDWSPEAIDEALGIIRGSVGDKAVKVMFTGPGGSDPAATETHDVHGYGPRRGNCTPSVTRYGGPNSNDLGHLLTTCDRGESSWDFDPEFDLTKITGDRVMAARDALEQKVGKIDDFWIAVMDDQLVVTTYRGSARPGQEPRVPLN
ncbi:hypothetical protein [Enemella sp. A6]|uniref:hypothetical protein n=1 Tax=Enemella sp. A6 TaxID=3440152 RepID=UPI003EB769CC